MRRSTFNLGLPLSSEFTRVLQDIERYDIAAQLGSLRIDEALTKELAGSTDFARRLSEVTAPNREFLASLDKIIRPARDLALRVDELTRPMRDSVKTLEKLLPPSGTNLARLVDASGLQAALNEVSAPWRDIKIASLLDDTVAFDLRKLIEQSRLQAMAAGSGGLLERVAARVDEADSLTSSGTLELGQTVDLSLSEMVKFQAETGRLIDPVSAISILLTVIFGLISIQSALDTNRRLDNLSADVERTGEISAARLDSLASLVDQLVNASIANNPLPGPLAETHILSRSLHLRVGPSAEALSIRLLSQGTRVEAIAEEGAWTKSIAEIEGKRLIVGWLYGRYLRPIVDE